MQDIINTTDYKKIKPLEKLKKWLKEAHIRRPEFACQVGVSPSHLSNCLNGHDVFSPVKCITIEHATNRKFTRYYLRKDAPTIWGPQTYQNKEI